MPFRTAAPHDSSNRDTNTNIDADDFHIGILGMEVYFPRQYVSQQELERHDGVSEGKYTVGLQQDSMAFLDQSDEGGEDAVSMALTCMQSLLEKYGTHVDVSCIGRVEVGTETPVDKSKSIKSRLMQLLQQKQQSATSSYVEGCDSINACYGGTNALLNAVYFLESHYSRVRRRRRAKRYDDERTSGSGDSRGAAEEEKPMYALVVCTDAAQYGLDNTSARATGGAGACAMLLGANAPLVIDLDLKCSFSQHTYDFWKGDPTTPIPDFEGQMSNMCYIKAMDKCYKRLRMINKKMVHQQNEGEHAQELDLDYFDYLVFHTPYNKLIQKALGRLLYNDLVAKRKNDGNCDKELLSLEKLLVERESEIDLELDKIREFLSLSHQESYYSSELHKTFRKLSKQLFDTKVVWSTLLSKNLGNTYTASLYMSLASLIYQRGDPEHGLDREKSILLYSYGSGFCSSMYVIRTRQPTGNSPFTIGNMRRQLQLEERLDKRRKVSPSLFDTIQHNNLYFYKTNNYVVNQHTAEPKLFPGTFYLSYMDNRWRRTYRRKALEPESDSLPTRLQSRL